VKEQHTVSIYALYEPGCDPWYVGCTAASLDERLKQHRRGQGRFERHTNITPQTRIGLIERVTGTVKECHHAEHAWIGYGHDIGWPLVNTLTAWPWRPGRHHSAETRRKMREAKLGKPRSAETRRKISETQKRNHAATRSHTAPRGERGERIRASWAPGGARRIAHEAKGAKP
jgi:hypothetical protein